MIFNVNRETFAGSCRNGDLIAVCNMIHYLRKMQSDLKLYVFPDAIGQESWNQDFFRFLKRETGYFSETPGDEFLLGKRLNVWDYRDISGDLVALPCYRETQKKIVICPVLDAPYNTYRNWPKDLLDDLYESYIENNDYNDYEKILCVRSGLIPDDFYPDFKKSTNFLENIEHIMSAEIFVGGDTGTSHFAWSLLHGPKELHYYNSSRGLVHTLPFHLINGKGKYHSYWINMENTTWN